MQPSGSERASRGRVRWYLLGVWTAAVLFLTLTPDSAESDPASLFCILCGDFALRNLILNVLLFIPLGVGLHRRIGVLGAVVTGLALSIGIELAQLTVPGRFSALGDVIANTAGAWVGAGLTADAQRWLFPTTTTRESLRWVWSGAAATAVLLSGLLLTPSAPDGDFFGNWTPEVGGLAPYPGRIVSASLGRIPVPSERLIDAPRVAAALAAQEPLSLVFVAAESPNRRAPLFRLIGEAQREVLRIDVDGADVLVRPRYLSTRVRLTRPELRFAGALVGSTPGDTLTMTVWAPPAGGWSLELNGREPTVVAFGPSQGWVVFSDLDGMFGRFAPLGDLLWGLFLFFPLGWWAARPGSLVWGVLPVLLVVAMASALTPLTTAPAGHFALAVAFAVVGHGLAERLGPRPLPDPSVKPR